MNLKDLSNLVMDSIQVCIDRHVELEDVDIYIGDSGTAYLANRAELRFLSTVVKHGILFLDNAD